jgi:hypothetical protein
MGMLIDGLSGTVPPRETTELVERSVDEGGGGLDEDTKEVDWPLGNSLAGAAPATIHKGMSTFAGIRWC